jgi:protein required for attachment to host cells
MSPAKPSWCLVVSDAARARLFSIEFPDARIDPSGPVLREVSDLVHPQNALPGRETFSEVHSGRAHASPSGPSHGLDDHRSRHDERERERFAEQVAQAVAEQLAEQRFGRVVLVAPPAARSRLRKCLLRRRLAEDRLTEVDLEISRQSPAEIQAALTERGVLPARAGSGGYRPRGQPPVPRA